MLGSNTTGMQRRFVAWFGIRGVGSIYYLMYAIEHGLPDDVAVRLSGLTLTVVAVSVLVHGISVTPLMERYGRRNERYGAATAGEAAEARVRRGRAAGAG